MDYKIINRLGPKIFHTKTNERIMNMLKDVAVRTKEVAEKYDKWLVGNIHHQYKAQFTDAQRINFINAIMPYIRDCVSEFDKDIGYFGDSELSYTLGEGPWINFQHKHEFNPLHNHTGILSMIIYIDVPEEIDRENENSEFHHPRNGVVGFVAGQSDLWHQNNIELSPKTGDMLIFPATLHHLVYPFKSDVERVSLSCNLYNLQKKYVTF